MLNIVFMGTPDFARDSLEEIVNAGHSVLAVVTTVDKPKGRGMKLQASPVKEYAILKQIHLYQPERIKGNEEFIKTIKDLNPDVLCVVAYGKILPKELLDVPKYGCINVHASLLPKYRGSAPIQWAIINGDKITGVTTMFMDVKMDEGDIILKEEVEIGDNETTGELWNRLSKVGSKLLIKTLDNIEKGNTSRQKQEDDFTLAPMIQKELGKIDWNSKTADEIKNLVRGLNPILGAYTFLNGKKYKIWKVDIISVESPRSNTKLVTDSKGKEEGVIKDFAEDDLDIVPGTVVFVDDKKGMYIKARDRILSILEIQAENSKKMEICEFLRGNKINTGEVFT